MQQFTPTSITTWWAVVADNLQPKSWVVRTDDSGEHWHDVSPIKGYLGSSFFLTADVAWIEAGGIHEPKSEQVYRTLDGGESWQRLGMVPSDCELQFVDERHGWCTLIGAAMGSESVDIVRTTDGGSSWILVSRTYVAGGPPGTLDSVPFGCDKSIHFTSPTIGWAPLWCSGGTPAIYNSTDGGSTWHELPDVPFPPGVSTDSGSGFGAPVVQGSDAALVLTIGGRPGATAISTSADGGNSWRTQLVPRPRAQWVVDLVDPVHWRLNDGEVVMATDDAGERWRTMTLPVRMKDPVGEPVGLHFLSADLGWAVPGANGGPFWWTTDGGISWKPITITAGPYRLPTPSLPHVPPRTYRV